MWLDAIGRRRKLLQRLRLVCCHILDRVRVQRTVYVRSLHFFLFELQVLPIHWGERPVRILLGLGVLFLRDLLLLILPERLWVRCKQQRR
jgi:hypothetical protein